MEEKKEGVEQMYEGLRLKEEFNPSTEAVLSSIIDTKRRCIAWTSPAPGIIVVTEKKNGNPYPVGVTVFYVDPYEVVITVDYYNALEENIEILHKQISDSWSDPERIIRNRMASGSKSTDKEIQYRKVLEDIAENGLRAMKEFNGPPPLLDILDERASQSKAELLAGVGKFLMEIDETLKAQAKEALKD